ncbi:hypothetical protein WME75_39730 [Sorangium sp. So ce1014]|uniref:hypothetical protein n=1 Tax=Sorangium sp. So ce1014 TaxID=3133326 RepID=UPI003F5DB03C
MGIKMRMIFQKSGTEGCIPACVLSVLAHRHVAHRHTEESLIAAIKNGVGETDFTRLDAGAPELHLRTSRIPSGMAGADNFLRSRDLHGTMVCLKDPANHCVVVVAYEPNDDAPSEGRVAYLDPNPVLAGKLQRILLAGFVALHTGEWARLP